MTIGESYPDFLPEVVIADPEVLDDELALGPLDGRHQLLHLLDVGLDELWIERQVEESYRLGHFRKLGLLET